MKDRSGAPVTADIVDTLAASLAGKTIRPGELEYEQARRNWNASVNRKPGLIERCKGTAMSWRR